MNFRIINPNMKKNQKGIGKEMQMVIYIATAFVLGVLMSIYLPMNSSISRHVGSPITSNIIFFFGALLTSILIFLVNGQFDSLSRVKEVPVYLYLTGFISAFMILGTTFLIPRLGARNFFILLIAGQVITAVIISHFGILESPKDPISIKKLVGASVVIVGAFMSTS